MKAIVGIDLSLTATGIATFDDTFVVKPTVTGMERLDVLRAAVLAECGPTGAVFIEGYAMGTARQAGTYAIGELGGVVRYTLWRHQIPYVDVPPATLKKFATNKGNAGKPDMLDASRRAGYDGSNNDNAVDAWWLRQFGLYTVGEYEVERFAYRDEAVRVFREVA